MEKQKGQRSLFQLVGGHPVLDFVNTRDWRFRPSGVEELLRDYNDLFRFVEQCGLVQEQGFNRLSGGSTASRTKALSDAKILRETIAKLLYDRLDGVVSPRTIQELEPFFAMIQTARHLTDGEPCMSWTWRLNSVTTDLPVLLLAQSAEQLLTSPSLTHVRACCNTECRWLFLDTSKNHSRRWCDMKLCGNRIKARRFKAAHAVPSLGSC